MREEAIARLRRHLNAVLSRRYGWAVVLWGEPGVGKTFTAQTLLDQTPCAKLSLHATVPERTLLHSLPRPPKRASWNEALRERLNQGQHIEAQTLADTLAATLSALAPFVLHLEDLHEASGERLELIYKLAQMVPRLKGVGLLLSSRAKPPAFNGYKLEPLDQAALDGLLEGQAKSALPREGLDWVFARTKGNPLFALEFWRYLVRQGFFWSDGQTWHWRTPQQSFVPVSVEALIAQMFSGPASDPGVRAVLEARAMFASEFELNGALWARVADVESTDLAQAEALLGTHGILQNSRFTHPLFGEVVRQEIAAQRKRGYARRALEALADDPEAAAVFAEVAELKAEQRQALFERAAASAETSGRTVQAGRWFARAAENAKGSQRGILAHLAAVHLSPVEPPEAIRLLETALEEDASNSKAIILLATNYARMGQTAEMERTLGRLPSEVATQEDWIKSLLGVRYGGRNYRGVIALWKEHPALHVAPDPSTAHDVGFAYMEQGDAESALALADPALEDPTLRPLQKVKLLALCGLARAFRGDLEKEDLQEAQRFLDQAVELARSFGLANLAAMLHNRQIVLEMLGLFPQAMADLREAIELYRLAGLSSHYASSLSKLGSALAEMGHYEEAEEALLEAHQTLSRLDSTAFLCTTEGDLCKLYLLWQPPHGLFLAQKYSQLALERARTVGSRHLGWTLPIAAEVATALGQPEQGIALAEESLQLDGISNDTRAKVLVAKAAALEALGSRSEAIQALELARSITLSQHQKIDLERARLKDDVELGREHLEWFRERGILGLVEAALRKWPELNETSSLAPQANPPEIYIKVLGAPALEIAGQPLPIRSKRRLEVLCYLLEARLAGRSEVAFLELLDTLYPEVHEAQAKATLQQRIYLIRSNLGADSIHTAPSGYVLGRVGSDIEEFLQTHNSQLWRGPYLQGLSDGWNANVRDALESALNRCTHSLLDSDPAEATRLGAIWLEMEPYNLDALRLSLRALRLQGKAKAAERTYRKAQERMAEVGEAMPETLEDFLYPKAY